ncbi:glutamine--fructose-6-phosphate transaminase (isomerizing) [Saccharobesus litoralis]|uniref:Glutamine--fructose-6-phosphate aminotransferase [isomerizing] n=1 Tax=Saccharobesus litoralis TaxID=2172099 RepID=A0A2S0VME0_9ALTE|nr:glutamine--fructose-6-phosphate transaminase (isomerizing) [Saccharobesus litoralis]AWB65365.1 glutamine--fructose-6-phosphate transaminase (isomerizing) [Saccharobesus litoralis]
MCGIYAAVSTTSIVNELISGLDNLSYRGYDSAGIAVYDGEQISRRRAQGKLSELASLLCRAPVSGAIGIAHTRWATHGLPNETNAHPHMTAKVAVVHNGIIENYPQLRKQLQNDGYVFESETDSETIPLLITQYLDKGETPETAMLKTISQLEGSFALVAIFQQSPDELFAARQGSPLVIGQAEQGFYISSDENALPAEIQASCFLEDGDLARITQQQLTISNFSGQTLQRALIARQGQSSESSKNGFKHFMLKEIHEQPQVFKRTLQHYIGGHHQDDSLLQLAPISHLTNNISRMTIVACGTSYYAGMVAKYWIESIAGVPVDLDVASEYRYRKTPVTYQSAALFISQSGETADTLAALRHAKQQGQTCFSIVNVTNSTMANESDVVLPILAGREIGVASTKAFTAQLAALLVVTIQLARQNGLMTYKDEHLLLSQLDNIDAVIEGVLSQSHIIKDIAKSICDSSNALFMGRGIAFPLALEGALKLKEISYIHAEAYPAGELKHGPIALVDKDMPIIVVAPSNELFSKTLSNLREVASRGARIILLSDKNGLNQAEHFIEQGYELPDMPELMQPIAYNIPMQLLAYYVATLRGTDVDQPRNLAKSVTVE